MERSAKSRLGSTLARLSRSRDDQEAWELLYRQAWPFVYATTTRMLRGVSHYAQDTSQEVFLRILTYCDFTVLQDPEVFLAYVRTICKNAARDNIRKISQHLGAASEETAAEILENTAEKRPTPEQQVLFFETLAGVLGKLDDTDRALLRLMLEGYNLREIDKRTGLTYSALATRIHRFRGVLRKHLKRKGLF